MCDLEELTAIVLFYLMGRERRFGFVGLIVGSLDCEYNDNT